MLEEAGAQGKTFLPKPRRCQVSASPESPFLQAIVEEPDDDTLRLIFADWLDERNDLRGDFIRAQCEVARLESANPKGPDYSELAVYGRGPSVFLSVQTSTPGRTTKADDPRAGPLRRRAWSLLDQHKRDWGSAFRNRASQYAFHRGLVERIEATGPKFVKHAPTWFAQAPLQVASINNAAGLTATILQMPFLSRLRQLSLGGAEFGNEGARQVAASPHLAGVRRLFLNNNHIGDAGAIALAESSHLGGLEMLHLWGNPIGPVGRRALQERFGERAQL
jgi:uncharacterized protein (TIGR02996 family)